MSRFLSIAAGFAFTGAALLPTVASASDPADVIDYRKHVMKTLGSQAASLGMIMQQKAPADNFAVHAEILAVTAATALKAFEPKVEGGDAKPEVWAQWADFSKKMKEFEAATADLAKAAKEGGVAAAGPKIQAALSCKGCHDVYKVAKK